MTERITEVVPVRFDDGQEFLIEVSRSGGTDEKVADLGLWSAKDLADSITSLSALFVKALKEVSPEKFSVEFGVEVSVKSGKLLALLCNGEGKGNLKITLEWASKS